MRLQGYSETQGAVRSERQPAANAASMTTKRDVWKAPVPGVGEEVLGVAS